MNVLLILLLVASFTHGQVSKICPNNCGCYLDQKGRNTVECKLGGMKGAIQFTNMSESIEILKISAPDDNMNDLSMNPGLRTFKNLEEIHIIKSNIPNLGERFFYFLKKLQVLNLAQNNITQALPMNFEGLTGLRELYLDDNRISSLPSETFRYLIELRLLSIQKNRIQQLGIGVFRQLGRLRVLKLSGNSVGHFNADIFKDLKNLRSLECRGCHLKVINRQVNDLLPLLTHLDLGENEITRIDPSDFVNITNLRVLKLDGNQIRTIPNDLLSTNGDLRRLCLAQNAITEIETEAFVNLANLTDLDVGYNRLEYLSKYAMGFVSSSLERLVLSGNRIQMFRIKLALEDMTSLKDLQLADSHIAQIYEPFVPDSVTILNLANNQLSHLSSSVLPRGLKDLDLSRNLFRGLSEDVVERVEHLRCKLENNPWSCDLCHIIAMLERVNHSAIMYNIRCAFPYHHTNKILGTMQRDELSWCNADGYSSEGNFLLGREDARLGIIAAGASLLLLIFTTFAVLAALCYSRRHAANYYTHEEKRDEKESIFENQSPMFGEELSFKFPLDISDMKISIATIDEIKKEHEMTSTTAGT